MKFNCSSLLISTALLISSTVLAEALEVPMKVSQYEYRGTTWDQVAGKTQESGPYPTLGQAVEELKLKIERDYEADRIERDMKGYYLTWSELSPWQSKDSGFICSHSMPKYINYYPNGQRENLYEIKNCRIISGTEHSPKSSHTIGLYRINFYKERKAVCPEGFKFNSRKGNCYQLPNNPTQYGRKDCSMTPHPINFTTGNKYFKFTDFNDPQGYLSFSRHYNSGGGYAYYKAGTTWTFSYSSSLTSWGDENERVAIVKMDDGQQLIFKLDDTGNWKGYGSAFPNYQLTQEDEVWELTDRSNKTLVFDSSGKLSAIKQFDQKIVTLTYTGNTVKLQDHYGRQASFIVDDSGRVVEFSGLDGRTVKYEYASNGNLIEILINDKTKHSISYEDAPITGHIKQIKNDNGKAIRAVTYDSYGKATSSELANGANKYSVYYRNLGRTHVTNALGKVTHFYYSQINGLNKITKIDGQASTNCAAANKNYEYFDSGLLKSKTDWQGVKTTYQYNDRGLTTKKTEAVGTHQARTTETQWHDTFSLPVKVIEPGKTTTYEYNDKGQLTSQSQESTK